MQNDIERNAIAIIIVFGALILGGLIAASLTFADRSSFFFALGSATAAWLSGYAMVFTRPRLFGILILTAVLMAGASAFGLAR
jgi:uncharacterized membrane protein (UPF0182 family)